MGGDVVYEWDEGKRRANLAKHGLDFAEAHRLDWRFSVTRQDEDSRGEMRFVSVVPLGEELVSVAYTDRGDVVRLISMRPAESFEIRQWKDEFYD